jgi:hypothetical protein
MATRTPQLRLSMLNKNVKRFLSKSSVVSKEIELGIQATETNGFDAILLDYVGYSINIESEDYTPMDKGLDYVIANS